MLLQIDDMLELSDLSQNLDNVSCHFFNISIYLSFSHIFHSFQSFISISFLSLSTYICNFSFSLSQLNATYGMESWIELQIFVRKIDDYRVRCVDEIVAKIFFYKKHHKMLVFKLFLKNPKQVKDEYVELILLN